jgi:mono/diheme cytochrome c family protein
LVGPDLDNLKPDLSQIRTAITQGVGAMPAYGGQLSTAEIDSLAAFVFEASR